jgi:hypothetical protein
MESTLTLTSMGLSCDGMSIKSLLLSGLIETIVDSVFSGLIETIVDSVFSGLIESIVDSVFSVTWVADLNEDAMVSFRNGKSGGNSSSESSDIPPSSLEMIYSLMSVSVSLDIVTTLSLSSFP